MEIMLGDSGALVDSCRKRQWREVCRCLEQGIPIDSSDDTGATPLQICAALGWTEAVDLLIKHGADIHKSCTLGWTALMQAARNGHVNTVKMLIDAGASLSESNSFGWDVLSLAVASSNEELLKVLIPMAKCSELNTALLTACEIGYTEAVKCLLNEHAEVNFKHPDSGVTPLMLAACGGHKPVVEILLSEGADPFVMNSSNLTALEMAVILGKTDMEAIFKQYIKPRSKTRPSLVLPPLGYTAPFPSCEPIFNCSHQTNFLQVPSKPCTPIYDPVRPEFLNSQLNSANYPNKFMYPSPPAFHTPDMETRSTQVFKFPPSPSFCCSKVSIPYQYQALSPHIIHNHNISPIYNFPHSPLHYSPSLCSSPFIPPWMFAYGQWQHKVETKSDFKRRKHFRYWWKKLKRRCSGQKLKKKVKVYVTFNEDKVVPPVDHLGPLLHSLNLEFLAPLLESYEVDVDTFFNLRESDLEEMGITDKAQQLTILQKIRSVNGYVMT